mmetsp:Transcript_78341/g.138393  ORF Transcript_78341/g.138393 Transcript_78341/m.138393 type:complete len:208 (+) Transcript_78341:337-960(+)
MGRPEVVGGCPVYSSNQSPWGPPVPRPSTLAEGKDQNPRQTDAEGDAAASSNPVEVTARAGPQRAGPSGVRTRQANSSPGPRYGCQGDPPQGIGGAGTISEAARHPTYAQVLEPEVPLPPPILFHPHCGTQWLGLVHQRAPCPCTHRRHAFTHHAVPSEGLSAFSRCPPRGKDGPRWHAGPPLSLLLVHRAANPQYAGIQPGPPLGQ